MHSSSDYRIELYTFDSRHFGVHHAFLVYWHNGEGYSYAGGPGDKVWGNFGIEDGKAIIGCGDPLQLDSDYVGTETELNIYEKQYVEWLTKRQSSERTGPYLLLGGREADEAKRCLDAEVSNLQNYQAQGSVSDDDNSYAFPYCPVDQNSNTIIFTLMRRCNIPNRDLNISVDIKGANQNLDY
jgi:hypothetical protein